jgi:hypothetical protein
VREFMALLAIKLFVFVVVIFAVVPVTVVSVTIPILAKFVLRELVLTLPAVRIPVLNVPVLTNAGMAKPVEIPVRPDPLPKKLVAKMDVAPRVAVLIAEVLNLKVWILLVNRDPVFIVKELREVVITSPIFTKAELDPKDKESTIKEEI